jgi:hypothetical protein
MLNDSKIFAVNGFFCIGDIVEVSGRGAYGIVVGCGVSSTVVEVYGYRRSDYSPGNCWDTWLVHYSNLRVVR